MGCMVGSAWPCGSECFEAGFSEESCTSVLGCLMLIVSVCGTFG